MSDLRVILLILGVIVVFVIYLYAVFKKRNLQDNPDAAVVLPVHEKVEPEFKITKDLLVDNIEPVITSRERIAPDLDLGSEEEGISSSDDAGDVEDNQLVQLHITALPTKIFSGEDILNVAEVLGLKYGDMGIFHHYGVGKMQSVNPIFSMANMFEPGNFDLTGAESFKTRGVTLFLCLPTPVDGNIAFELMLSNAHRLAKLLNGELRASDHNMLSKNKIENIREEINTNGNE